MDNDGIAEIGARATFDDYWKRHGDEPGAESVWLQVKHIHIGNMRAALAAFAEAGLVVERGWRFDMGSAPVDEPLILATTGEYIGEAIRDIEGDDGAWFFRWAHSDKPLHPNLRPIAWRPLPAPPAAKADPQ